MTLFRQKKRFAAARAFSSIALTGFTLLASGSLLAPAHAWSYTTTSLGIGASDINDSDFVVGAGPTVPPAPVSWSRMWTWDPINGAIVRGNPTTMPGAGATAVTDSNPVRIAGDSFAPGPDSFNASYWTYSPTSPPSYIPTALQPNFVGTGEASHANAADDADGIAGHVKLVHIVNLPPAHACWWLATTASPTPSPTLLTSYGTSTANDITAYGAGFHNIVGWGSIHPTTISKRAFVTVVNNSGTAPGLTELFPADTSIQSEARAINANGTIVGSRNGHAFVFVPFTAHGTTGIITYLSETPSGGTAGTGSYAWDINDNGTIVGYYLDSLGVQKAARWDAPYSGNVIDLNAVVSIGTNNNAKAINSAGNIIVNGAPSYSSQLLTYHP